MALINCPECGRENISDTAEQCPGCGYLVKKHFEEEELKKEWQEKHLNYTPKPRFLGNPALAFGDLELDFNTNFKPILSKNI